MIVYHGSDRNFRKLRIAKDLVQHDSSLHNEGLGIYFTTDLEVAKSYGKYVYTLEINDKYLIDFRKKAACSNYVTGLVREIYKNTGIDIRQYLGNQIDNLINYMYFGGIQIHQLGHELYMLLESNERFYMLGTTKTNSVYKILRQRDRKQNYAYMFNYHIKNIGVIKSVDDNIVRIIRKDKREEI